MPISVFSDEVSRTLADTQRAAAVGRNKTVLVDGEPREVSYPFPSPGDWRDCWIYFLMIDRFNNPSAPPNSTRADSPTAWNQKYAYRQGGTFKGVQEQLKYIEDLGAHAIWLSPVLKNSEPDRWEYNYHGYGAQDFLSIDERFASDGTRATAERELIELIDEAHARHIYVIMDIVLNHAGRVFDYERDGQVTGDFGDPAVMNAPLGQEPAVEWLDGSGVARPDWRNDNLPKPDALSPDDVVWPSDLQRAELFRRRGHKLSDDLPADGFIRGDFGTMRQLVVEYDARAPGQEALRERYGRWPVLNILVRAYSYLVARYDLDGFRIDTVKYVAPDMVRNFGNAMREFALSIGKSNFFTFGEIADANENNIASFFVGRSPDPRGQFEGFGIDAALDFPLWAKLRSVVKGWEGVETIREIFEQRKEKEQNLISSHGEAGRYFVSFVDNHDQHERFNHPTMPRDQVTLGLGLLFSLQGIPCLYYGTEQGLQGTVDENGQAVLDSPESVREALWGRKPLAFDPDHPLYRQVQSLVQLRDAESALRYGRFYFREISGDGQGFGLSRGQGGIVAFSRILVDREVVVVANTSSSQPFSGYVVVDLDLSREDRAMSVAYSNLGNVETRTVSLIPRATFYRDDGTTTSAATSALAIDLAPLEIQILVPGAVLPRRRFGQR